MIENTGKLRNNNFGALRLIFACLVIVSHSPEMLDGNALREPLRALGSHATFGGLAVDGFFIISGYLIASSFLSSRSLSRFLISRILRIYPAFIIASLLCLFVVGPIAGGALAMLGVKDWAVTFARMLFLWSPQLPGAFHTLRIPALDGSMWTIRYEFRCYLLVALLGVTGLIDRRGLILLLTAISYAVAMLFSVIGDPNIPPGHLHQLTFGLIGDPVAISGLSAIFMSGVCARLYRDKLRFPCSVILIATIVCIAGILRTPFPDLVAGTVGAYLVLWMSTGLKSPFLQRINNSYDYSYGLYLYAWPIASFIILAAQRSGLALSPIVLTCSTAILATLAGAASWYTIERPMLRLKLRQPAAVQVAIS